MARAQGGDRAAYDELLRRCDGWLGVYLRRRLQPGWAEDVGQEVLMAVHLKRATYDPRRPFGPWLAGIARYKMLDRLRAAYKETEVELTDQGRTQSHERAVLSDVVLGQLLGALPEAQARAIRLVKIEGLSVAEAARAMDRSEAWVKVNVHRGRKRMLARLERDDG